MMLRTSPFMSGFFHVLTIGSQTEETISNYLTRALNPDKRPLAYMYDVERIGQIRSDTGGLLSNATFQRASQIKSDISGIRCHWKELSGAFRRNFKFMITVPLQEVGFPVCFRY